MNTMPQLDPVIRNEDRPRLSGSAVHDEISSVLNRGMAHLAEGELDCAAVEFTQAIQQSPNDSIGFVLRGQVYEKQGEDDQALADFSTAIQIDVGQLLMFAQRLVSLTTQRDFDGAVADADQSLRINQRLCRTCFLRGGLYARRGEWAKAIADYSQVLQLDAANSLAFVRRGDASARLGEWSKAVADYTEAIRLDPKNTETFNSRGDAFRHLGQSDRALADFTEALRLDPQFTPARINRADTHLRRGEYDQAVIDYNQATHLAPGAAWPYAGRGLARVEKGDCERALADISKAMSLQSSDANTIQQTAHQLKSTYDAMVDGLNRFKRLFRQVAAQCDNGARNDIQPLEVPSSSVSAAPPKVPIPVRNSNGFERKNPTPAESGAILKFAKPPALSESDSAQSEVLPPVDSFSLAPESSGEVAAPVLEDENRAKQKTKVAFRHCLQGRLFHQGGEFGRAIDSYNAALAADPKCTEALLERATIHRKERRFEEALEDCNAAIELNVGAEAFCRRGMVYAEQGQREAAIADFDEVIRLDSTHAIAYLHRGLAHFAMGEYENALEDAGVALENDFSLTRAQFLRGMAHGKLGRPDLARRDFDVVLAEEPGNARAHNQRGLAYSAEGQFELAIDAYTEALRLSPEMDAAFFNRGSAYFQKGDYDRSAAEFTEFIQRRPQHALAHHHRGLALLGREDFDAAIADFTHAFQLDPTLTQSYTSCLEATRAKYESLQFHEKEQVQSKAAPARPLAHNEIRPETVDRTLLEKSQFMNSSKMTMECPECGTYGLLDLKNLNKRFRCPGCKLWWRTNAGGHLEKAAEPEATAIQSSAPAPPAKPESETKPAPGMMPGMAPASSVAKPAKAPAPPMPRRKRESNLNISRQWLGAALKTRSGKWAMAACVILLLALVPVAFPSLFPSKLRSRAQQATQAWLAKDVEQIRSFTEPIAAGSVPRWLETNPPPDLAGQNAKPVVNVSVQRNNGSTAEIIVQIKALKSDGTASHYAFKQRWVSQGGTWYLQPSVSPGFSSGTYGGGG